MDEKYGNRHRQEKQKRIDQNGRQCEYTGSTRNLEAHHAVPRLFNGADLASNYQILESTLHNYLHQICNVTNNELVGKRIKASNYVKKHILEDEKREAGIDMIESLDNIMLAEYVARLVFLLEEEYKGMIYLTMLSNAKAIRDLSIENYRLRSLLDKNE